MTKVKTTLFVDEQVLRGVKAFGRRTSKRESEVIEDALRRYLGFDLLDRVGRKNDLDEAAALALALEAQHETRPR